MIKIKTWLKLMAPVAMVAPVAISCGATIDSAAKQDQDKKLKSPEVKAAIKQLYNENLISSLYGIKNISTNNEESLADENSEFYKDAYAAWLFYQGRNILNNITWYEQQITTWNSSGISNFQSQKDPNIKFSIDLTNPKSENTFKALFLNTKSPIRSEIVNMLIVKRYLLNQKFSDVKKTLSDYDTLLNDEQKKTDATRLFYESVDVSDDKTDFFFIKYLVKDAKLVTQWKYSENPKLEVYLSGIDTSISSIKEFNDLINNSNTKLRLMDKNSGYDINGVTGANADNLYSIQAFSGVVNLGTTFTPIGDFDWSLDALKKSESTVKQGFRDVVTNILYTESKLKNNSTSTDPNAIKSVKVSKVENNKVTFDANYFTKIVPFFIKKEGSDTEGKFTFLGTPWSSMEQQRSLAYWVYAIDSTKITELATKYFVTLGYTASSTEESIKENIKGEPFYKE